MKLYILSSLLFILSTCGYCQDSTVKWGSKYRNLKFQYGGPWTILPTSDTKEKTLTGVIDNRDGKSYIIQITEDIAKEKLSDKRYFEGIKQTMLQANQRNKLIAEDSMIFHAVLTHRQVYLMYTDIWGLLKQVNFVTRNGIEFISVQILFPTEEKNTETSIPYDILAFDKNVKINSN